MPRNSRIDAPGALHHIIVRGIERSTIFKDNTDRHDILNRLGAIIQETKTRCLAWALIPNHFHLLVKTGYVPVATVMRRLLTGHAVFYNKRHRCSGHLFQNRYKSILCQEDAYLLELVRYIHLNPIRANIVKDLVALDKYRFCGHSVLMGKVKNDWQDIEWVLKLYDERLWVARRQYRAFVRKGVSQGRREDLIGGGLIRSAGGWAAVKAMRKAKMFQKSDERILGDGDFVEQVLSTIQEKMERKYTLMAQGYNLDKIVERISSLMNLEPSEIRAAGKERRRVAARSLLCFWAVRDLGISTAELSRQLKLSISGISLSVKRGEKIAQDKDYKLISGHANKNKQLLTNFTLYFLGWFFLLASVFLLILSVYFRIYGDNYGGSAFSLIMCFIIGIASIRLAKRRKSEPSNKSREPTARDVRPKLLINIDLNVPLLRPRLPCCRLSMGLASYKNSDSLLWQRAKRTPIVLLRAGCLQHQGE